MDYSNNPMYEQDNTPVSPPRNPHRFATAHRDPNISIEELSSYYRDTSAMEAHPTPSTAPSTAIKQGVQQTTATVASFQNQIKLLQSMFPDKTKEEIFTFIWPTQTEKAPAASPG